MSSIHHLSASSHRPLLTERCSLLRGTHIQVRCRWVPLVRCTIAHPEQPRELSSTARQRRRCAILSSQRTCGSHVPPVRPCSTSTTGVSSPSVSVGERGRGSQSSATVPPQGSCSCRRCVRPHTVALASVGENRRAISDRTAGFQTTDGTTLSHIGLAHHASSAPWSSTPSLHHSIRMAEQ